MFNEALHPPAQPVGCKRLLGFSSVRHSLLWFQLLLAALPCLIAAVNELF